LKKIPLEHKDAKVHTLHSSCAWEEGWARSCSTPSCYAQTTML